LILIIKNTISDKLLADRIIVHGTMGSWFSTPWDPSTGIPDLDGKVAIVTGAK
jgi:hypothetical protein